MKDLLKNIKFNAKYLKIKHILKFNLNLSELVQVIIELKASYDFKLLEIDYLQLINSQNQDDLINICQNISNLAKALNIVIISPMVSWAGLQTNEKNFIETSSINSYSQMTDVADIVFTINFNEDNNFRLFLDKNKFGLKRKDYRLFRDPSVSNWII